MLADVPGLRPIVLRHFLSPAGPAEARAATLIRRASLHALLVHVAALARADDWPAGIRHPLEAARRQQAFDALRLAQALGDVQAACDAEGLRLLVLKGLALATVLHGDIAARQSGDIDVLVSPDDFGRLVALLEGLGYVIEATWRGLSPAGLRHAARTQHEFVFHRADGVTVEAHTRLTTAFIPYVPSFEALWRDRQLVRLQGRDIATTGWSDTIVHLSTHGYRHAWARLGWLCDIAHVMARADVAWDEVERRARRQREWVAVTGALLLAHEVLGAPMPARCPTMPARSRRAAAAVAQRLAAGRVNPTGRDMVADHWRSRDSVPEALRYLWRVATTMTPADCVPGDTWPPSPATRLLRRPLRLLRRYAIGS